LRWGIAALLLAVFLCLPTAALPIGVYRHHENASGKIALTFDDGPHPRYTGQILDILDEYGVRATFFFVGENVSYYPDAARDVARRGHEIGNHTYTHPSAVKTSSQALREELQACERIIQSVTDTSPKLFRPPEGSWNEQVLEVAREQDYSIILWDIDTLDWAHTPAEKISSYVLENTQGGNIILMHDYQSGSCGTMQALRMFIPELLARGYKFVTVSELLGSQ
jgi:polysaccharide deacetylase family sporulation protein PdaB